MNENNEIIQAKGQLQYDASAALVLTNQAQNALTEAKEFIIDSADMYGFAAQDLQKVMALKKRVEETRTNITGPLNQAVKAINDLFRPAKTYLEDAEASIKHGMLTWSTEQERIAAEARRVAEAAAQLERERLAKEQAEQERIAREAVEAAQQAQREALAAQQAQEQAQRDAEAAALRGDQAAQLAAEQVQLAAQQAQTNAEAEAAQQAAAAHQAASEASATAQTAEVLSMPVAVVAPAKVSGISTSKTMDFEVTDLHALICHVAENPRLIGLLVPDAVKLRAQVRATGMHTNLPGVRVFEKRTVSARSA